MVSAMGRVEGRVALDLDSECTKNWLTIRNLSGSRREAATLRTKTERTTGSDC